MVRHLLPAAALLAIACDSPSTPATGATAPAKAARDDKAPPPPAKAPPATKPTTGAPPTATPATSDAAAGEPTKLDLGKHGLPLEVLVPACVQVKTPHVKVAGDESGIILECPAKDEGIHTKPVFSIQVGLAKGKIWKDKIQQELGFVRFTKDEPDFLQWEESEFGSTLEEFMLRTTLAGVAYACFPQFAAAPEGSELLAAELAACRSLAAKAP